MRKLSVGRSVRLNLLSEQLTVFYEPFVGAEEYFKDRRWRTLSRETATEVLTEVEVDLWERLTVLSRGPIFRKQLYALTDDDRFLAVDQPVSSTSTEFYFKVGQPEAYVYSIPRLTVSDGGRTVGLYLTPSGQVLSISCRPADAYSLGLTVEQQEPTFEYLLKEIR